MVEQVKGSPAHRLRLRASRLGIRTFLLSMVLLPILATAGLGSSTAISKWSDRERSIRTQSAALRLGALMQARAAITDEYVPSAAIVYASARGVSLGHLDRLLRINFADELAGARKLVDSQAILSTAPTLASDGSSLRRLRSEVDARSASFGDVQSVFSRLAADIGALWTTDYSALAGNAGGTGPATAPFGREVSALQLTYNTFNYGLAQSTYAEQILVGPSTPQAVVGIVGSNALLETVTAGFPGALGPRARRAWTSLQHNSEILAFDKAVTLAVRAGLNRAPSPYASNVAANANVFRGEIAKLKALTTLVLAASADLRSTAAADESSATSGLVVTLVLLALLVALVIAAALWMAGAITQPLARIADAAGTVRQGDFDVDRLEEVGPRELATAAVAFNDMAATLSAVESHAVALSGRDLEDPVLQTPLPGRTGRALQGALDRLQKSVKEAEDSRQELHALATRDSLTGLYNRGAALDAIDRDMARAAREASTVALLFIDVDGLKAVNDTFGHKGGDEALRAIAVAVDASTRRTDVRARIGGDEFIVAQLQPASPEDVEVMAERICQRVAAADLEMHGHRIRLSCSIGIALSIAGEDSADDLIRHADTAMYEAKEAGRNRVAWFQPPTNPTS